MAQTIDSEFGLVSTVDLPPSFAILDHYRTKPAFFYKLHAIGIIGILTPIATV
jgi:hypothetical protein